jgi:nicotinate-nucleotide adenylyltransferase
MENKAIGILGGTFNPIHFGHMRLGLEMYQKLHLKEVRFLPCYIPVHKQNSTTVPAAHRVKMLELATMGQTQFIIDTREIERNTPSYMIDTLDSLRQQFPHTPLCLILGRDSFLSLTSWKNWHELVDFAHIIVGLRPRYPFEPNAVLQDFLSQYQTLDQHNLHKKLNGTIYLQNTTQLAISSTSIREHVAMNLDPSYLLPAAVYNYILDNRLYM